jgi:hypothetical protein
MRSRPNRPLREPPPPIIMTVDHIDNQVTSGRGIANCTEVMCTFYSSQFSCVASLLETSPE